MATFDVDQPQPYADKYAWALSAFASAPWERAEVP
jgi:hypothetical protein